MQINTKKNILGHLVLRAECKETSSSPIAACWLQVVVKIRNSGVALDFFFFPEETL